MPRCATMFIASTVALSAVVLTGVSAAAARAPERPVGAGLMPGGPGNPAGSRLTSGDIAGQVLGSAVLTPVDIDWVSCASAGNCSAGGSYSSSSGDQAAALVVSEKNGIWGAPRAVVRSRAPAGNAALAATDTGSCASAGNCSAGGYLEGSGPRHAFIVDETDGSWGTAQQVPGLARLSHYSDNIASVSCGAASNCSAGGDYTDRSASSLAFVVSEKNGRWGTAQQVPGTGKDAGIASVSCASEGNCSAGGGEGSGAFVVSEKDGIWGTAQQVPGTYKGSWITSVSCASAGNCSAGGSYTDRSGAVEVFVVSQKDGTWGTALPVPGSARLNTGGNAEIVSMSCASAGNCGAGGDYAGPYARVFVVSQKDGIWGTAQPVPGVAFLNAVSCGSAGNCSAVGDYYVDGCCFELAFLVSQKHGIWGTAQPVPGLHRLGAFADSLNSVSCASAGNCTAGGSYATGGPPPSTSAPYAFTVSETHGCWHNASKLTGAVTDKRWSGS
jgi:hypothetical protein